MLTVIRSVIALSACWIFCLPFASQAQSLQALPGGRTFVGSIDVLPIVAHIAFNGNQLTGHYFYLKTGEPIQLRGTYDAAKSSWKITESVKEKTTGFFVVGADDSEIGGLWSAKSSMTEAREVSLTEVELKKYEPGNDATYRINGQYFRNHAIESHEGEDESGEEEVSEIEATDDMYLHYIGDGKFYFYISVIASNFNTGEVSGLGKMTATQKGVSLMDDCELGFDFSKPGEVTIEEQDCDAYHGARAYFGMTMKKAP